MTLIPVTLGAAARLSLVLEDGDVTQFPQVNLYEPGNATPVGTIDLSHLAEGLYEDEFTPTGVGILNAVYTVYEDAARTIANTKFGKELDQLVTEIADSTSTLITEILDKVCRILGLVNENAFIDNTEFDNCDQLISSRVRIFDTAANANAATDGGSETAGLVASYQVTVFYEGPGRMKSYRMVKL